MELHLQTFQCRDKKKMPGFVDCFGWCSWDAFYTDVSAKCVDEGLFLEELFPPLLPFVTLHCHDLHSFPHFFLYISSTTEIDRSRATRAQESCKAIMYNEESILNRQRVGQKVPKTW